MGSSPVMLATTEEANAFHRCHMTAVSDGYVELQYLDVKRQNEIIHRSSCRLWHGATDESGWIVDPDGVTWRPNSHILPDIKQPQQDADSSSYHAQQQQEQLQQLEHRQPLVASPHASAPTSPSGIAAVQQPHQSHLVQARQLEQPTFSGPQQEQQQQPSLQEQEHREQQQQLTMQQAASASLDAPSGPQATYDKDNAAPAATTQLLQAAGTPPAAVATADSTVALEQQVQQHTPSPPLPPPAQQQQQHLVLDQDAGSLAACSIPQLSPLSPALDATASIRPGQAVLLQSMDQLEQQQHHNIQQDASTAPGGRSNQGVVEPSPAQKAAINTKPASQPLPSPVADAVAATSKASSNGGVAPVQSGCGASAAERTTAYDGADASPAASVGTWGRSEPLARAADGIERVPAGEIGAGLPVIRGGAGEAEFMKALHDFWSEQLGDQYPRKMPSCSLMAGQVVEPWHLWRQVWSFGGPDAVSKCKLWATIGFCFSAPASCTSVSSRIKRSYEMVLAPLDQAIDAGSVKLKRPSTLRKASDRMLQLRPPPVPGATGAGCGVRRNKQASASGTGSDRRLSSERRSNRGFGVGSGAGGSNGTKRKLSSALSSDNGSDDFEGARIDDVMITSDQVDANAMLLLMEAIDMQQGVAASSQTEAVAADRALGHAASEPAAPSRLLPGTAARVQAAGEKGDQQNVPAQLLSKAGYDAPPPKRRGRPPKNRATDPTLIAATAADGLHAVGRATLTQEAGNIKVGQHVDFRQPLLKGRCVDGWRSGVVIAINPGSEFEGGKCLLIQPDSSQSQQQQQRQLGGSITADSNEQHAGDAGDHSGYGRFVQVPLLWRGPGKHAFATPVVMVRLQHPSNLTQLPRFAAQQQREQVQQQQAKQEVPQQQQQEQPGPLSPQQLASGMQVEAFKEGRWWPAQVKEVLAEQSPSSSARWHCVVQHMPKPEADGAVCPCTTNNALRDIHPQHATGYGILAAVQKDLVPIASLRKRVAPYMYAGGIETYSCFYDLMSNG